MNDLSVYDECLLLGSIEVMKKNVRWLDRKVHQALENYEATDCDAVAFVADVEFAIEQNETVLGMAEKIGDILTKLRHNV